MKAYLYGFLNALLVYAAGVIGFLGVGLVCIYFGYRSSSGSLANVALISLSFCLMTYAIMPLSLKLFRNLPQVLLPRFVYSSTISYAIIQALSSFTSTDGFSASLFGFIAVATMILVFHLAIVRSVQK